MGTGGRAARVIHRACGPGEARLVPDRLPRLDAASALARVALPVHLNWAAPGRVFNMALRADWARVYEVVSQEGRAADILAYVDGLLLTDLWDDLVLPRAVLRAAGKQGLPASRGAALLAQHLTARPTEDLDFFTAPERGHVPAARDPLG